MKPDDVTLPTTAKQFFLRRDFPDELSFIDFATSRAVRRQVQQAVYCGHDYPPPILDAYDIDLCESYRRARFFMYLGMGVKGLGCISAFVSDGVTFMPTKADGLYQEMLDRAARAFGTPNKVLVFPAHPEEGPMKDWIYPKYAVLHDTKHSTAAIVTCDIAFDYLKQYNP